MAKGTYTYDPASIKENGKDRMRFELGDTMVEGGSETSALTDEEYAAALEMYPERWKRAKLACLESICRRFAYEPDTKEGPLSFSFSDRAKLWRDDYDALKKEVSAESMTVPNSFDSDKPPKPPYFYSGMMENRTIIGRRGKR